jgi:hypothetical protein
VIQWFIAAPMEVVYGCPKIAELGWDIEGYQ